MSLTQNKNFLAERNPLKNPLFLLLAVLYATVLFIDGMREPLYCDESSFLKNLCGFFVFRTTVPAFTNYPTFFSYLIALPVYLVYFVYYILVRHFPLDGIFDPSLFAIIFQCDLPIFLWVGRIIGIFFAVTTMALVFKYCVSRLAKPASLLALSLLFCSPFGFYMSHARYALPDIFVAFMATSVLIKVVEYIETSQAKSLYLAGLLAGLAGSAKLNGLFAVAPILVAPWVVPGKLGDRLRVNSLVLIVAFLGFFVGSPLYILNPEIFQTGFNLESSILFGSSGGIDFQWLLPALWKEDPVTTVLVLGAIAFSVWRHSRRDMVFHALLIPSVICLGSLSKQMPYYMLFLFPWLCVLSGEMFEVLISHAKKGVWRGLVIAVMLGIIVNGGCKLAYRLWQNSRVDNRVIAADWIRKNIPASDHILFDRDFIPIIGTFYDLDVLDYKDYSLKKEYKAIFREYVKRDIPCYFDYWRGDSLVADMKEQGWKYFVTSNYLFNAYLTPPSQSLFVQKGTAAAFQTFLWYRIFYSQLFHEKLDLKVIEEGSGPKIYIFRLL